MPLKPVSPRKNAHTASSLAAFKLATLCFEAAGKPVVIKRAPAFLFDVLAFINKLKKTGKDGVLKFGKWTMTEEMVGDTVYGNMSFAEYIKESFKEEN